MRRFSLWSFLLWSIVVHATGAENANPMDFLGVLIAGDAPINLTIEQSPALSRPQFEAGELPVQAKDAIQIGRHHASAVLDKALGEGNYVFDGVIAAGVVHANNRYFWRVAASYRLPDEGERRRMEVLVLMDRTALPPLEYVFTPANQPQRP